MPVFGLYNAWLSSRGYPGYLRKSHSGSSGRSGVGRPLGSGADVVPRTMPSEIRVGILSCCGITTSVAVFPGWTLFHNAVKELQSPPVSGVLGSGRLAESGRAYARYSGSLRVAQDCSPPTMGLAIESKRSEIIAEANKRLQDTSLGERIIRERPGPVWVSK